MVPHMLPRGIIRGSLRIVDTARSGNLLYRRKAAFGPIARHLETQALGRACGADTDLAGNGARSIRAVEACA